MLPNEKQPTAMSANPLNATQRDPSRSLNMPPNGAVTPPSTGDIAISMPTLPIEYCDTTSRKNGIRNPVPPSTRNTIPDISRPLANALLRSSRRSRIGPAARDSTTMNKISATTAKASSDSTKVDVKPSRWPHVIPSANADKRTAASTVPSQSNG